MRSIEGVFMVGFLSSLPAIAGGGTEVLLDASLAPEGVADDDWASIRAAYEAGRHEVLAADGGHRARNPRQQWTTHFDGHGFTITPAAGGWSWGLELARYGWGADLCEVARPRSVLAEGGRLEYEWDERLAEWYVNDVRGLEHGYTVAERPEGALGPLVIELSIRGELDAEVSADGRDVRFLDARAEAALNYEGLAVFDADGRTIAASWTSLGELLQLRVHDHDARYPLMIDPIVQQGYLKASNTSFADSFGESVSVYGDTVVVGAVGEDSNATGVNGDQANNLASDSGAAYVFVRSGLTWSQEAYVKASNTQAGDRFGSSVSISGNTLVVGAIGEDSNATGVNGDQGNDLASASGSAYVFVRSATTWSQQAYLKASNTAADAWFGTSVSISSDTIAVGASREGAFSGAVYAFVRNGTAWNQQAYLKASNAEAGDSFGTSVSLSADTVVVGAPGEDSDATGVNGNQGNVAAAGDSGAAYVFVRNGSGWSQEAYLKASNTEWQDSFGDSVSVSEDTLVVGATGEDSNAKGVNGNQGGNLAADSGAAYVFVRNGSAWSQEAYLKASNTEESDVFGNAVSVSGDAAVVAARGEASQSTGVNGNQSNNFARESGAVYVFVRSGTTWGQEAYLKASNSGDGDDFGESLSLFGDTLVVGASDEDSNATGVNGNQSNALAQSSGAAYVLDLYYASVVYCTAGTSALGCQALIGSAGTASATAASGFSLLATGVESQNNGLFFFGTNGQWGNPWGNSTSFQCVVPPVTRAGIMPGSGSATCDGSFAQDLNALWCPTCPKPQHNPGAGAVVQAQLWYRDPLSSAGVTSALSDAIEFPLAP